MDYKNIKQLLSEGWLFRIDNPFEKQDKIILVNPKTNETMEIDWQLYHRSRNTKLATPIELPNDNRHYYGQKNIFI